MEANDSAVNLDTRAAATYLDCSYDLLVLMRRESRGPKFFKCGKSLVRYRRSDLDAWIDAQLEGRSMRNL